ncbi:MAG: hypothetical protein PVH96_13900 [Gemmatimonadota bacterium]|jgi:hypothetical protein
MHLPSRRALLSGLLAAAACGTGPDRVDLGGTWHGTTLLPNAYSTTFTVIQSGTTISGNVSIVGVLNETFVGTFHEHTLTVAWAAQNGCEDWSGTFAVDSEGSEMSGPVVADYSGCSPARNDDSGTISLSK